MVASDVVLTNAAGMHAVNIPEHAIALVCALARNLHVAQRLKAERRWDRYTAIADGRRLPPARGQPPGGARRRRDRPRRRAARARARHARARDAPPARSSPSRAPRRSSGPRALHALLGWADFVVIATPLTPDTQHLIDAAALAAMRSSAHLVNVGRGEIVDDAALVEALRAGGDRRRGPRRLRRGAAAAGLTRTGRSTTSS